MIGVQTAGFNEFFSISLDIKERFAIGLQLDRSSLLREGFFEKWTDE